MKVHPNVTKALPALEGLSLDILKELDAPTLYKLKERCRNWSELASAEETRRRDRTSK